MKKEIWKKLPDLPRYEVSNKGRVRRRLAMDQFYYFKKPTKRRPKWAITLKENNVPHGKQVARLVGAAFCKDFHPDKVAGFKDGDSFNCAASNLIWNDRSDVTKACCFRGPRNQEGQRP